MHVNIQYNNAYIIEIRIRIKYILLIVILVNVEIMLYNVHIEDINDTHTYRITLSILVRYIIPIRVTHEKRIRIQCILVYISVYICVQCNRMYYLIISYSIFKYTGTGIIRMAILYTCIYLIISDIYDMLIYGDIHIIQWCVRLHGFDIWMFVNNIVFIYIVCRYAWLLISRIKGRVR